MRPTEQLARILAIELNGSWEHFTTMAERILASQAQPNPDWFHPSVKITTDDELGTTTYLSSIDVGGIEIALGFVHTKGEEQARVATALLGLKASMWQALEGLVSGRLTVEEATLTGASAPKIGLETA